MSYPANADQVRAEVAELLDEAEHQPRQLAADAVLDAAVRWFEGHPGAASILASATQHWLTLTSRPEPLFPDVLKARRIRVKVGYARAGSLGLRRRVWSWKCECGYGGSFCPDAECAADSGRRHLQRMHTRKRSA